MSRIKVAQLKSARATNCYTSGTDTHTQSPTRDRNSDGEAINIANELTHTHTAAAAAAPHAYLCKIIIYPTFRADILYIIRESCTVRSLLAARFSRVYSRSLFAAPTPALLFIYPFCSRAAATRRCAALYSQNRYDISTHTQRNAFAG